MGIFARIFFQLGLRGLKQNAVEDWSAGRGGPVCHLGLGDGRILEIHGFGAPIGHLGLRNDCLLDMRQRCRKCAGRLRNGLLARGGS